MVSRVAVPSLDLQLAAQVDSPDDSDCKTSVAFEKVRQNSALFDALISPRRVTRDQLKDDFDAFDIINKAFKDLMNPLIRSYDDSIGAKQHRAKIEANKKKIRKFRDHLFTTNLLGPRHSKSRAAQVELCEQYIQKLYVVCKEFLSESAEVETPSFSSEVITPRKGSKPDDFKRLQADFQMQLRHAENVKDSILQRCTGDICVLSGAYFDEANQIETAPPPDEPQSGSLRERVKTLYKRITTPRSKND